MKMYLLIYIQLVNKEHLESSFRHANYTGRFSDFLSTY